LKNFYQLQDPEGEADKPLMTKIRRWFCALEKAHKNVPLDEFESLFSSNQNTLFSLRILPLLKFSLRILPLLKKITDYVE
jgi:predicted metal-dependent hydrolase